MSSSSSYQKRRSDIRERINRPQHAYPLCLVLGCDKPTMARQRKGLNANYCRSHVEHYRRHGSYSKPSYTARELNPHRAGALAWLQRNGELPEVVEAVDGVRILLRRGHPEEAFRLAGRAPEDRARVAWARLRSHQVDPLQPLAAWLAVLLCHASDPQPERKIEFRWVQGGKLIYRLSGGTHKRWERHDAAGEVVVTELHKYPASRGRVLRHLGEQLAGAARPLEGRLESIRSIPPELRPARLARVKKRVER